MARNSREKLPVQKKAAACGDERGIGPRGQGQEGEHDQQGKGIGLQDADEKIFLAVAGRGPFRRRWPRRRLCASARRG